MAVFGPIQALGTLWYFEFFDKEFDTLIATSIATKLRDFEAHYSRFKANSWLSRLNTEKEFLHPDPEFVDLLTLSLYYYEQTGGVFNIAVGEKMEAAGYNAGYSFAAATEAVVPLLPEVLTVTPEKITLIQGRLDLGGIGKGYLIDSIAHHLQTEFHIDSFLINGGGDMYATHHNGAPVEIQMTHPQDLTKYIATAHLYNQGFAASSPFVRAWKDVATGKEYNHLHTENKVASYIIAENTTMADVYATYLSIKPKAVLQEDVKKLLVQETFVLTCDQEFQLVN